MPEMIRIELPLRPAVVARWSACAQKGMAIPCRIGESLADILTKQLGMDAQFLETIVRTVFHNSSPVDSLDTIMVADGDMIALAGAMPGLVGIAMGRNSPVGGFRSDISNHSMDVVDAGKGRITIKAFNVVVPELVRLALGHGVFVEAELALELLQDAVGSKDEKGPDVLEIIGQMRGEVLLGVDWQQT